jgi:hypothetical protein
LSLGQWRNFPSKNSWTTFPKKKKSQESKSEDQRDTNLPFDQNPLRNTKFLRKILWQRLQTQMVSFKRAVLLAMLYKNLVNDFFTYTHTTQGIK